MLFNQHSTLDREDDVIKKTINIIQSIKPICVWVETEKMSDEEKEQYPTHKTTGGYLKERSYKYCWQRSWEKMSDEDKEVIKSLPNFCPIIFKEITGIDYDI